MIREFENMKQIWEKLGNFILDACILPTVIEFNHEYLKKKFFQNLLRNKFVEF